MDSTELISTEVSYRVLFTKEDYIKLFKEYELGKFIETESDMYFYYDGVEYDDYLILKNSILAREYTFKQKDILQFRIAEITISKYSILWEVIIKFLPENLKKFKEVLEKYYPIAIKE